MLLPTNRGLRFTLLSSAIILGACAESTGVDEANIKGLGGKTSAASVGGKNGAASGGTVAVAKGGATGIGGAGARPGVGGAASTTLPTSGGATSSFGGASSGGLTTTSGGSSAAAGGSVASTIPAPQTGLGIKVTKQDATSSQTATTFLLVNGGSATVDLKSVTIRYYFTIDSWSSPVLDIDYAGPIVAKSDMKAAFVSMQPAQSNADRYIEFSFTTGSLGASIQTEIQTRLHDASYGAMTSSNDYSFRGATGFTELMTIFVSGQLAWGVEPGTAPVSGAGGASGVAGAAGVAGAVGTVVSGAGGSDLGSAGTSASAGSDPGTSAAGTAGSM